MRTGREPGERHRESPLEVNRDDGKVEELIRIAAHQARGVADARIAAPPCGERKEIDEELPDPERGPELDREGALNVCLVGVCGFRGNPNLVSRAGRDPLPSRRTVSRPVWTMNLSSWSRWMCSGPPLAPRDPSTWARPTSSVELSSRLTRAPRPSISAPLIPETT
jgi:hypothetical protein